jgi:hypothetical protein
VVQNAFALGSTTGRHTLRGPERYQADVREITASPT